MCKKEKIDAQKIDLKAKLNKVVDEYYEEICINGNLDINKLEEILVKNKEKMCDILNESASEAVGLEKNGTKKKNVIHVKP